jgi:hypothetical protein
MSVTCPKTSDGGFSATNLMSGHDLTLVGNLGSDPGDELQIIHRLPGGAVLAGAIADLALGPQKGQPPQ